MNYKIVNNENGTKSVVFEDGTKNFISTNGDGKEFFYVSNHRPGAVLELFVGRIKDAIEAIRNDEGDVLTVGGLFGKSESVVRFLDREYGESLRQQTLERYKDSIFGYSLKFGYLNSMNGSRFVSSNLDILGYFDDQNDYIFFTSEKEAKKCREKLLADAKKIVKKYEKMKATQNDTEISAFIKEHYKTDMVSQLWVAMAEEDEWKLEIVQVIKPVKEAILNA